MINQTPTAQPAVARVRWGEVIILSSVAGLSAGAATLWGSWHIDPAPVEPVLLHVEGLLSKFILGDFLQIHTELGSNYQDWLARGGAGLIYPRVLSSLSVAVICFVLCSVKLAKRKDQYIHVAGRRLLADTAATSDLAKQAKEECETHGSGIKLHHSFAFNLSTDRETRHFLILGSIGGGKTQVMLPLILAAQERGDRMIVHDSKGDFTSMLPGDPILIAPWDERSMAWDVAADCRTKQDARELATRLVPESKDPMWSFAARQVLVGFLISLQEQQGTNWGWRDLAELVPLPQPDLLLLMAKYNPEAVRAVEDASKTTQSILITLSSYMSIVFDLADAWGDKPGYQRLSFLAWLADENHPQRTLILQNSGGFSGLSRAYICGIIGLLSSRINSPDFEDSKTRKIFFFLDEFVQLGKVENFSPLLEVGRSKGVRVVIGAQDMAQIRNLYGKDEAQSWASMVGTQIFARINPGETADWIAKLVGNRIVERPNLSVSGTQGGDSQNVSRSFSRETVPVLLPSQLSDELGSTKGGVKCLLLGYKNANILLWPFTTLPKLRPVSELAGWAGRERPPISDDSSNIDSTAAAPVSLAQAAPVQQEQIITPATLSMPQSDALPLLAVAAANNTAEEHDQQQSSESSTLDDLEQLMGIGTAPAPEDAAAQPAKKRRIVRKKSVAEAEQEAD